MFHWIGLPASGRISYRGWDPTPRSCSTFLDVGVDQAPPSWSTGSWFGRRSLGDQHVANPLRCCRGSPHHPVRSAGRCSLRASPGHCLSHPRRYGHLGVRLPDGPQPIRANRRLGPPEPGGDGCPEPGAAGRPSALSPRVPQRHRERLDHGRVVAASRGNSAAEVRFLDRRLTTMTSPGSSTRRSSRSRGLATADSRLDDGKYPEPRAGVGA